MVKKECEVIIELKNVFKHYLMGENVVKAVDGLSIKVNGGEFVAIMGPSGSGKSTAMNLVGSLDVPTKGNIFLDGEDISTLSESDLAQIRGRKIGFIFQSFNLIPNLTAKENVMLPMMFQGTEIFEREEVAERLLKLVDLGDRANHYPNELSGGQMQRVAIARALANDPEGVLADEPTGNLDSATGNSILEVFEQLNRDGQTIVMVTHDSRIALRTTRTIQLVDGRIQEGVSQPVQD